jgi:hypothetical protein
MIRILCSADKTASTTFQEAVSRRSFKARSEFRASFKLKMGKKKETKNSFCCNFADCGFQIYGYRKDATNHFKSVHPDSEIYPQTSTLSVFQKRKIKDGNLIY